MGTREDIGTGREAVNWDDITEARTVQVLRLGRRTSTDVGWGEGTFTEIKLLIPDPLFTHTCFFLGSGQLVYTVKLSVSPNLYFLHLYQHTKSFQIQ